MSTQTKRKVVSTHNANRKRYQFIKNWFVSMSLIKAIIISTLTAFSSLSYSSASQTYYWSSIEGCRCGLEDGAIKNQSLGVLFSQTNTSDESIGFAIDFSGLNHIAFQANNNFYNPDYNALMIENNQFTLPEAEKFIKLAHSFNTSVDLFISSQIDGLVQINREKLPSAGDIIVVASDIVAILEANKFDGVTIDLESLFNNDLISYRRLVEEIIKALKKRHKGTDLSVSVIISDKDLLALLPNNEQHDDAQLFFKLLDKGFNVEAFDEVHNRLLIRTNKVRKLDKDSFLFKQCKIIEGPFIDHNLQYSDKPFNRPLTFPANRAYPLVSLPSIQKQLKDADEICRERYFEEFIINKYQGLAFEDASRFEQEIEEELLALDKWYPPEYNKDVAATIGVEIEAETEIEIKTEQNFDRRKAWSNLSMLEPIQNVDAMGRLKYYQHVYLPGICEVMCPYQEDFLKIAFSVLLVLALLLFISQVFYSANTFFQKTAIYFYMGFVFLACLIQIISLCAIKHELIRNWTFVVISIIIFISWIWHRYKQEKEGSFP